MERWRALAGTFAAVTVVVGVEHLYLWLRLVRDVGLTGFFAWFFVVLAASVPFSVASSRVVAPRIARWWVTPAFTWLGVSVLLSMALAMFDVARLFIELSPSTIAVSALAVALTASLVAVIDGRRFRVKRVELVLKKLPASLDGFRIAQLSDVHLGPTNGRAFMERVVNATNQLAADAVVITGDLVDAPVEQLTDDVAPLARLSSKLGTFFITGNHEYFAGARAWCAHLTTLGIRVLRNERVALGGLDLAGTDDDDAAGRAEGFREDLPRALEGRDVTRPLVLLAHQPKSVSRAQRLGVDLQLSGHTHGGQLWPLGWLLRVGQPLVSGLSKFGDTQLYVSNGTGHSGPPMRLSTPAEVTLVVLRCA